MERALTIVNWKQSKEIVDSLESLLARAKTGELTGLVYVSMYRGQMFDADAIGEARRNAIVGRGMLCAMNDALAGR